jgi:hypothetical protein
VEARESDLTHEFVCGIAVCLASVGFIKGKLRRLHWESRQCISLLWFNRTDPVSREELLLFTRERDSNFMFALQESSNRIQLP